MGRPSKLTTAVTQRICDEVENNLASRSGAAYLAGVSRQAIANWIASGEAEQERLDEGMTAAERVAKEQPTEASQKQYVDFLDELLSAEARLQQRIGGYVMNGLKEPAGLQHALKVLGRLGDGRFDERPTRVEHTGKDGGAIELSATQVTDLVDQIFARLRR